MNESGDTDGQMGDKSGISDFTLDSTVKQVLSDTAFGDFGRLLFPVGRTVSEAATLSEISSDDVYVWYSDIRLEKTVEIVNHLKVRADAGEKIYFPIYFQEEIREDASEADAPTYVCVGIRDGIASWNTMKSRLDRLKKMGISTEFHKYKGLSHGFGIGTGTVAEGWLDDACSYVKIKYKLK